MTQVLYVVETGVRALLIDDLLRLTTDLHEVHRIPSFEDLEDSITGEVKLVVAFCSGCKGKFLTTLAGIAKKGKTKVLLVWEEVCPTEPKTKTFGGTQHAASFMTCLFNLLD